MSDWIRELSRLLGDAASSDAESLGRTASDFGGVVRRQPQWIVRPRSAGEVAHVLKFAATEGVAVSVRGAGHSQSGQSLSSGIVLETDALAGVRNLDAQTLTVRCGGGTRWRALLAELAPQGLSPPVLTNNLDVTVGGTLSTAGLGVASWRHGTQADHCLELEVVTGAAEVVRCSAERNRELFDAARAGLGQFGVITEATLRLRRHEPRTRTFYLLYDELTLLVEDLRLLMDEERFDYLESWCAPCPQGFRKAGGTRQPFAQWFYPLHVTLETDGSPPAAEEKLAGLRFYRLVHTEDGLTSEFFTRLDALFALWKQAGFWDWAHPWMECILPWAAAPLTISQVLAHLPPQALAGGHILLWPGRGNACNVPLFMRPAGDYVMGFGLLPAVPPERLEEVLPRLAQASAAAIALGGKRYLSGWLNFDAAQWKTHYGDLWPELAALKRRFDPAGVLGRDWAPFG